MLGQKSVETSDDQTTPRFRCALFYGVLNPVEQTGHDPVCTRFPGCLDNIRADEEVLTSAGRQDSASAAWRTHDTD